MDINYYVGKTNNLGNTSTILKNLAQSFARHYCSSRKTNLHKL